MKLSFHVQTTMMDHGGDLSDHLPNPHHRPADQNKRKKQY